MTYCWAYGPFAYAINLYFLPTQTTTKLSFSINLYFRRQNTHPTRILLFNFDFKKKPGPAPEYIHQLFQYTYKNVNKTITLFVNLPGF